MITPDIADVFGGWCLLFLCSTLYDMFVVGPIESRHPPLGVTAWLVVGGVLYTAIVIGMVYNINFMLAILFLFSGAGIPMILGSHWRHQTAIKAG